jgi:DNA helicase IV
LPLQTIPVKNLHTILTYIIRKFFPIFKSILMLYLIVLIGLIVLILIAFLIQKNNKKQAELIAEKHAKNSELIRSKLLPLLRGIHISVQEFDAFLIFNEQKSVYFNQLKLNNWQLKNELIYQQIKPLNYKVAQLNTNELVLIQQFFNYFEEGENVRKTYNEQFIQHSLTLYSAFFDDIEGRKLDTQQRIAVVTDEDNNLIIAGAGSGKTTTIAGKVAYLIHRYDIKSEEILLISFTKKAADDMQNRIAKKMGIQLDAFTFHKLGKEIIAQGSGVQPSVFNSDKTQIIIENIISELIKNDNFKEKIIAFFIDYLKIEPDDNFKHRGQYIQYLKDQNIQSLKKKEIAFKSGKKTYLREICKSFEEVKIANFLLINGIKYNYEMPYKEDTRNRKYGQYRPDFYLPDYDIYIEHWGIDANGNVPQWFAGDKGYHFANNTYKEGMEWKRKLHKSQETTLIETHSFEHKKGTLLKNLKANLIENNVAFKPLNEEQILALIKNDAPEDYKEFIELTMTFLSLFKANNYTIDTIYEKIKAEKNAKTETRNTQFVFIFEEIWRQYTQYLINHKEIDFNDMINQATFLLQNNKIKKAYKYILIDEFQDISIGRFSLIKALLNQNKSAKLFAVGDDWQSIYRFAGSDIAMFTNFQNYFGTTAINRIETTYRFNSNIIELSSDFVLKNPHQVKKSLKSFREQTEKSYEILYSEDHKMEASILLNALKLIVEQKELNQIKSQKNESDVLILGRYNSDINTIERDTENFKIERTQDGTCRVICSAFPTLKMQFLTVHKSKGLEANYVVIWNCLAGRNGFPSERADDPLLNLLLTQADQFPNGEERRLFYVALTRCRERVYITTNLIAPSKFVDELEAIEGNIIQEKCPSCKTGNLTRRPVMSKQGKPLFKVECTHAKYGCEHSIWEERI